MSSGRSRKRKKGRSQPAPLAEFSDKQFGERKLESDGIDLKFLVLGMVTTMMIGLLVYSQLRASPGTERALSAANTGEALAEVNSIDKDEFAELVESGNPNQLQNVLRGLSTWSMDEGVENAVTKNQRRVDIANRMLTMSLDSEQRQSAVLSKLEALETVYGLGLKYPDVQIPNVAQDLKNFAKSYGSSPEPDLSRRAHISFFKVEAFENAKDVNPDVALLVNRICELLKKHPDDDSVLSTVDTVVEYFRLKFDRSMSDKICRLLASRKDEFTSPKVLTMIKDFDDEAVLAESKYLQLFENRWLDGARGQQELLKRSIALVSRQDPGRKMIATVDKVAHWFEQDGMYESANAIYKAIVDSADFYKSPDVAADAKKRAKDGSTRIALVGKRLDLTAHQFDGREFAKQTLEKKIVVVVFWSMYDDQSKRALEGILPQAIAWRDRGIRVLAVNVDRKRTENFKEFLLTKSSMAFVCGDPKNNYSNNILAQCPSSEVPRLMLVNRDGSVADINVPYAELQNSVDSLDDK